MLLKSQPRQFCLLSILSILDEVMLNINTIKLEFLSYYCHWLAEPTVKT